MALSIPVPQRPFSRQSVSLGNTLIYMTFKFNVVNNSWYLDLEDSNFNPIKLGIRILANQNLTARFDLDNLPEGDLWCIQNKSTTNKLGRDNFGQDKDYGLYWVSEEDRISLGVPNAVQF